MQAKLIERHFLLKQSKNNSTIDSKSDRLTSGSANKTELSSPEYKAFHQELLKSEAKQSSNNDNVKNNSPDLRSKPSSSQTSQDLQLVYSNEDIERIMNSAQCFLSNSEFMELKPPSEENKSRAAKAEKSTQ